MNRKLRNIVTSTAITSALALAAAARTASAVPVNALYLEDARCDPLPNMSLSHELGQMGFFPINEQIQIGASNTTQIICVPQDASVSNDWVVQMTNNSGVAWRNLFFVGNLSMSIGNSDGNMMDVVGAPGVVTDAFKIDGTVTIVAGGNNNLIAESGAIDEIFSPGETWRFLVTNFNHSSGASLQPQFNTPGLFAGSAPVLSTFPDTASILAQPVPEPTTIGAIGLIATSLLLRRPKRV